MGTGHQVLHGRPFRRARLGDPETWPATEDRPSAGAILDDQVRLGVDPKAIDVGLEADYRATLWEPGGG